MTLWRGRVRGAPDFLEVRNDQQRAFHRNFRNEFHSHAVPKRQRAGALHDAGAPPVVIGQRASVLECGGPPPLFMAHETEWVHVLPHPNGRIFLSLTIAQLFMAGFTVWEYPQSRQGRKKIVCRP